MRKEDTLLVGFVLGVVVTVIAVIAHGCGKANADSVYVCKDVVLGNRWVNRCENDTEVCFSPCWYASLPSTAPISCYKK